MMAVEVFSKDVLITKLSLATLNFMVAGVLANSCLYVLSRTFSIWSLCRQLSLFTLMNLGISTASQCAYTSIGLWYWHIEVASNSLAADVLITKLSLATLNFNMVVGVLANSCLFALSWTFSISTASQCAYTGIDLRYWHVEVASNSLAADVLITKLLLATLNFDMAVGVLADTCSCLFALSWTFSISTASQCAYIGIGLRYWYVKVVSNSLATEDTLCFCNDFKSAAFLLRPAGKNVICKCDTKLTKIHFSCYIVP